MWPGIKTHTLRDDGIVPNNPRRTLVGPLALRYFFVLLQQMWEGPTRGLEPSETTSKSATIIF
jgi:hypothetical protein